MKIEILKNQVPPTTQIPLSGATRPFLVSPRADLLEVCGETSLLHNQGCRQARSNDRAAHRAAGQSLLLVGAWYLGRSCRRRLPPSEERCKAGAKILVERGKGTKSKQYHYQEK